MPASPICSNALSYTKVPKRATMVPTPVAFPGDEDGESDGADLVSRFSSRTSSSSFFLSLCSATGLEPSMLVPLLSPRFCVSAAPPCSVPGCGGFGRPLDFHCATTRASSGPVGIGFRKLYWILSLCGDCFMSKFMCARSLSSWCNWFLELWLCFARRCTRRTEPVPAIRDTSPSRVWQSSAPQQMFDLHFWKSVPASL